MTVSSLVLTVCVCVCVCGWVGGWVWVCVCVCVCVCGCGCGSGCGCGCGWGGAGRGGAGQGGAGRGGAGRGGRGGRGAWVRGCVGAWVRGCVRGCACVCVDGEHRMRQTRRHRIGGLAFPAVVWRGRPVPMAAHARPLLSSSAETPRSASPWGTSAPRWRAARRPLRRRRTSRSGCCPTPRPRGTWPWGPRALWKVRLPGPVGGGRGASCGPPANSARQESGGPSTRGVYTGGGGVRCGLP